MVMQHCQHCLAIKFVHEHYDLNNNKAIGTSTKSGGTVSCNLKYTVNQKKTWQFIFDYNFG